MKFPNPELCDWLRQAVFQPNLKYLHVKITVSKATKITMLTMIDFETKAERFPEFDAHEIQELKKNSVNQNIQKKNKDLADCIDKLGRKQTVSKQFAEF